MKAIYFYNAIYNLDSETGPSKFVWGIREFDLEQKITTQLESVLQGKKVFNLNLTAFNKVANLDKDTPTSRQRFETWWQQEMNTEAMPLTRTEYPMVKDEDQQYLCHDTNRGWLTWQANDETNAADTLDAKRYRWLADGYIDTYSLFVEAENKAQLDAAIDESMAECWEAQNKDSK